MTGTPMLLPGGPLLVSADGHDALFLQLDLRSVPPRDRAKIGERFLRDCVGVAAALPSRRAGAIGQTAIHALRRPGEGETISVAFLPPHHRLSGVERFVVADALCSLFGERGYRLWAAGLTRWAASAGLDGPTIGAGQVFLARWAGPGDTRLLAADTSLAPLFG